MAAFHVRFKVNGTTVKRELFDYILSIVDLDYPYPPDFVLEMQTYRRVQQQCQSCGGREWKSPNWGPEHLKRLARQINALRVLPGHFGLKMKHWEPADKCPPVSTPAPNPYSAQGYVSKCTTCGHGKFWHKNGELGCEYTINQPVCACTKFSVGTPQQTQVLQCAAAACGASGEDDRRDL